MGTVLVRRFAFWWIHFLSQGNPSKSPYLHSAKDGNLTLHEDPISGNCYKVAFTASLAQAPLPHRAYLIAKGQTRIPDFFFKVSSIGQIPVPQVGTDTFIPESNPACFFLANNNATTFIPANRLNRTEELLWIFFE
jgi:glutathione S-transferase